MQAPGESRRQSVAGGLRVCRGWGTQDESAHSLCLDSVPAGAGPLHSFSFNLQKKASRCYLLAHLTEEETEAEPKPLK